MLLNTNNLPTFLTVAVFTAILIQDLLVANYKYMLGHFLFGCISVLLIMYLVDSGATLVAYGVLLLPFVLLLLGWSIDSVKKASGETAVLAPPSTPRTPCSCYRCRSCPCICPSAPSGGSTIDISGSTVPTTGGTKGTAPSTTPKLEACGPGSASGKTQCVNVGSLTSV